jgi:hypothetical protein
LTRKFFHRRVAHPESIGTSRQSRPSMNVSHPRSFKPRVAFEGAALLASQKRSFFCFTYGETSPFGFRFRYDDLV